LGACGAVQRASACLSLCLLAELLQGGVAKFLFYLWFFVSSACRHSAAGNIIKSDRYIITNKINNI
ncbi:hypothetical protein, partial [Aeromonas caviae]|uniref:hypothetical protein n=1 Tax=Aeromonas caviae TaxID=648 RepID=UPI0029D645EE